MIPENNKYTGEHISNSLILNQFKNKEIKNKAQDLANDTLKKQEVTTTTKTNFMNIVKKSCLNDPIEDIFLSTYGNNIINSKNYNVENLQQCSAKIQDVKIDLGEKYLQVEGFLNNGVFFKRSQRPPVKSLKDNMQDTQHIRFIAKQEAAACNAFRRSDNTVALNTELIKPHTSFAYILPDDFFGRIEDLSEKNLPPGTEIIPIVPMKESDRQELEKLFITYYALTIKLNMLQNTPTPSKKTEPLKEPQSEHKENLKSYSQPKPPKTTTKNDKDDIKQKIINSEQKKLDNILFSTQQSKQIKKSKEHIEQEKQDNLKSLLKSKFLKEDTLIYLNKIYSQNVNNIQELQLNLNLLNDHLNKASSFSKSEIESILNYANNIQLSGNNVILILLEVHNQLMPTGKEKLLLEKLAKVIRSFGSAN